MVQPGFIVVIVRAARTIYSHKVEAQGHVQYNHYTFYNLYKLHDNLYDLFHPFANFMSKLFHVFLCVSSWPFLFSVSYSWLLLGHIFSHFCLLRFSG